MLRHPACPEPRPETGRSRAATAGLAAVGTLAGEHVDPGAAGERDGGAGPVVRQPGDQPGHDHGQPAGPGEGHGVGGLRARGPAAARSRSRAVGTRDGGGGARAGGGSARASARLRRRGPAPPPGPRRPGRRAAAAGRRSRRGGGCPGRPGTGPTPRCPGTGRERPGRSAAGSVWASELTRPRSTSRCSARNASRSATKPGSARIAATKAPRAAS